MKRALAWSYASSFLQIRTATDKRTQTIFRVFNVHIGWIARLINLKNCSPTPITIFYSYLNQEYIIPLRLTKIVKSNTLDVVKFTANFWRKRDLPSISRIESESSPEILCTQVNRMNAERRNSKAFVDTMAEYKYIFQYSDAMSSTHQTWPFSANAKRG